jgi:hypothetical protein
MTEQDSNEGKRKIHHQVSDKWSLEEVQGRQVQGEESAWRPNPSKTNDAAEKFIRTWEKLT